MEPNITVGPTVTPEITVSAEPSPSPDASASDTPEPQPTPQPVLEGFDILLADGNITVVRYTGGNANATVPAHAGVYPVVRIAAGAFSHLPTLQTVTVEEGVTTVESGAFSQCDNLTLLTLPASLTNIAADAVTACPQLKVEAPQGTVAGYFAATYNQPRQSPAPTNALENPEESATPDNDITALYTITARQDDLPLVNYSGDFYPWVGLFTSAQTYSVQDFGATYLSGDDPSMALRVINTGNSDYRLGVRPTKTGSSTVQMWVLINGVVYAHDFTFTVSSLASAGQEASALFSAYTIQRTFYDVGVPQAATVGTLHSEQKLNIAACGAYYLSGSDPAMTIAAYTDSVITYAHTDSAVFLDITPTCAGTSVIRLWAMVADTCYYHDFTVTVASPAALPKAIVLDGKDVLTVKAGEHFSAPTVSGMNLAPYGSDWRTYLEMNSGASVQLNNNGVWGDYSSVTAGTEFWIQTPGTYPLDFILRFGLNYYLYATYTVIVTDENGNLPTDGFSDYFTFDNQENYCVAGPLYYAPDYAQEVEIGQLEKTGLNTVAWEDITLEISFVGGADCADMRFTTLSGSDRRFLMAFPKAGGAAGTGTYALKATLNLGEGQPLTVFTKYFPVTMRAIDTAAFPSSPLSLTQSSIALDYRGLSQDVGAYSVTWPGIVLGQGEALPAITAYSLNYRDVNGTVHALPDLTVSDMMQKIIKGQSATTDFWLDSQRLYQMYYSLHCGNLVWEAPFVLNTGVSQNDASSLFSVNTQTNTFYYNSQSPQNAWIGSFYSEDYCEITDYGAAFVDGDDPDMQLTVYTDQTVNPSPHTYTEIGATFVPTRAGTSVVRLWATLDGVTYDHEYTLVVRGINSLPSTVTLDAALPATVKAGEHFTVPGVNGMNLTATDPSWFATLAVAGNDNSLLQDNGVFGNHGITAGTEYWLQAPGHYALKYCVNIGANMVLYKQVTITVTDADGNVTTQEDASHLFGGGMTESTLYFSSQGYTDGLAWLCNLYSDFSFTVESYGADYLSGDDPDIGLYPYTDAQYAFEPHSFTDVGLNIKPTRTGTTSVRLWAVVNGIRYYRDFTFQVISADEMPAAITWDSSMPITVKAGEHFTVPGVSGMNLSRYSAQWNTDLRTANGEDLHSNEQYGNNGISDSTEYWFEAPGHYRLQYWLYIGANYRLYRSFVLGVTDAAGNLPQSEDASHLFDINVQQSPFYYSAQEQWGWVGNLYSEAVLSVDSYGASFLSGDDPDILISQNLDHDTYTQLNVNVSPTRTGVSVIRAWVKVEGVTYTHDYTVAVEALPDNLPTEVVLSGAMTISVNAGEHFGLPDTVVDFDTLSVAWTRGLYIHDDDGSLLSNNDVWDSHDACENTRYWVNTPGRYLLTYYVCYGANRYINADILLIVNNADGTKPLLEMQMDTVQWALNIPTVLAGWSEVSLGNASVPNVKLENGDTETWRYEIRGGSYTGKVAAFEYINAHRSADLFDESSAVLCALFATEPGEVTLRTVYDAYDAGGNHIYHGEGAYHTYHIVSTMERYDVTLTGTTDYVYQPNEDGFMHIPALIPSAISETTGEPWDTARGEYRGNFWLAAATDTEHTVFNNSVDGNVTDGFDITLDPTEPGVYVLCQETWTEVVGVDLYQAAYIRITVGNPSNKPLSLHSDYTYPEKVSRYHSDTVTYANRFWLENVLPGDTVTWTLEKLSGNSINMKLYQTQTTYTQTVAEGDDIADCLVHVTDILAYGATTFRLTAVNHTAGGQTYTGSMDFTLNVVDDASDPAFLPTFTAQQVLYTVNLGDLVFIPTPKVTYPQGISKDEITTYWRVDNGYKWEPNNGSGAYNYSTPAFYSYEADNGIYLYCQSQGKFTVRFNAVRGYTAQYLDYGVYVNTVSHNDAPSISNLLVQSYVNDQPNKLDYAFDTGDGSWKVLGKVQTMAGFTCKAVNTKVGAFEVYLGPRTASSYTVFARCLQTAAPNASITLRSSQTSTNFTAADSYTFTLSAPHLPLAVTAVTPETLARQTGSTITWTVATSDGFGQKQYYYTLYNGNTVVNTPAWVNDDAFTYAPTAAGRYALKVQVKDTTGTVTKTSAVTTVYDPLTITAVAPTEFETVTGEPITWTVTANGGSGTRQYYYALYNGGTIVNTPAWASSATFTYTPTATGNYALSVKVKDGTATVVKASAVTKVLVPLTVTAVTPDKTSVYVGEPITWTLHTSGGLSTKSYYCTVYNGSVIVNVPAWESSSTFTYTPATTGSYALSVKVKDNATQVSKTSAVTTVAAVPLRIDAVTPSQTAAITGASVTWTVTSSGGSGTKQYLYTLYNGSAVVNTPTWVGADSFSYTPSAVGNYALAVKVKDNTATASKASAVTVIVKPLSVVSVTPSQTSAVVSEAITWTVATDGGVGAKQYYYTLYNGSNVVNTPAWETDATFTYTPTAAGRYALAVKVKDTASTAAKASPVTTITEEPLAISAITPNKTAAIIGDAIAWTITADGGVGAKQYYYTLYQGSAIVNTPAWGSSATFTYTPTQAGSYALSVKVKDSATTVTKVSAVTTVAEPLSITAITPGKSAAKIGENLTWTVTTDGGAGSRQYYYTLYNGGSIVNTPAWGNSATFNFTTTEAGVYALAVKVKDSTTTVAKVSVTTTVATPLTVTAVQPGKTTANIGESLTWTVTANGGAGTKQYYFTLYNGGTVVNTPAWGTEATFTFTTVDAGKYALSVKVKDSTAMVTKTSAATIVATPLAITAVTPSKTAANTGESLTWTVTATGGFGVKQYYYALYKGSAVVNTPAWSSNATFSFTPTATGTYALAVKVKDSSATVSKASGVTVVTQP